MDHFVKWLIGDLGTPGDYAYTAIHLYSFAAVGAAAVLILLCQHFLNKKPEKKRAILVGFSIFQLAFEVIWRLVYLFVKQAPLVELWPCYPCNLGGILLPIIALTDWKRGKKMFYLFAFVGAVLTFAIPDGIFSSDVLVFPILKSILQHTGILLIPMLEYSMGTYRSSLKDLGWVLLGCSVHLFNCEVIDRLFGLTKDYMFMRSDLPFVIPGVPQFITVSVFGILVLALLSFLASPKDSIDFLRQKRGQKVR